MARRTFNNAGQTIALQAPVPAATSSYSPIPHSFFLEDLRDRVNSRENLEVTGSRSYVNGHGTKLVNFIYVRNVDETNDFGLEMMIGSKNSYDKSMAAALVAGASVMICSNGIVGGDMISFKRKHTGNIAEELNEKADIAIQSMIDGFTALTLDVEIMRNYDLTQREKAEILGVMYFEENMVTPNQLSIIKKEMEESDHFRGNTLWDLYNNVTESLKRSHPYTHIEDHIKLHGFMRNFAGIVEAEEADENFG